MSEKKDEKPILSEIDIKAKSMGAVHAIKIESEGKLLSLYLKKPHRDVIGLYYGMKTSNPIKASEMLLKASCIMDISDKEIFEDDSNFYSACMEVDDYLEVIKLKKSHSVSL